MRKQSVSACLIGALWAFSCPGSTSGLAQAPGRPQEPNSVPPEQANILIGVDSRLVIVMAALNMAGYDTEMGLGHSPLRLRLRADLGAMDSSLRTRLADYYQAHKGTGTEDPAHISRFIALSLLLAAPPAMALETQRVRLPADVAAIADFAPLVQEFYGRSGIAKWGPFYQREHEGQIESARRRVGEVLFDVINYLHITPILTLYGRSGSEPKEKGKKDDKSNQPATVVRRLRTRHLYVLLNPLDAVGSAHVRNDLLNAADTQTYRQPGDDYFLILGPPARPGEFSAAPIRTALIRYMVEPLGERFAKVIQEKAEAITKTVSQVAGPEAARRETAFSIVNESLVGAIEARWNRIKAGDAKTADDDAVYDLSAHYERGAVLVFHFYERLVPLEQVGVDIATYYEELVRSINVEKEVSRAAGYRDVRARVEARRAEAKTAAGPAKTVEPIVLADQLIQQRRFEEARTVLQEILKTDAKNGRALYGLAQVTSQLAAKIDPEKSQNQDEAWAQLMTQLGEAVKLYRQAIENTPPGTEKWLVSQARVAIGRILDYGGEREAAIAEYQRAVELGDVPGGAYAQAKEGLQRPLVK